MQRLWKSAALGETEKSENCLQRIAILQKRGMLFFGHHAGDEAPTTLIDLF